MSPWTLPIVETMVDVPLYSLRLHLRRGYTLSRETPGERRAPVLWIDGWMAWMDGWMNEWRGLLGSWRGPHGRLDPLDQGSLARSRSRSPGRPHTASSRTRRRHVMSGVPTTEKCLLPRVVMRCSLLLVRRALSLLLLRIL